MDLKKFSSFIQSVSHHFDNSNDPFTGKVDLQFLDQCLRQTNCHELIWWKSKAQKRRYLALGFHQVIDNPRDENLLRRVYQKYKESTYLFGAVAFHQDELSPPWQGFKPCHFVIPKFILIQESDHLTIKYLDDLPCSNSFDSLFNLEHSEPGLKQQIGGQEITHLSNSTDEEQWNSLVKLALKQIHHNEGEKVVLSMMSHYQVKKALRAKDLFISAKNSSSDTYEYFIQVAQEKAFMSLTPESLYRKTSTTVFIDAIAGTRARSSDPQKDEKLSQDLLASEKDLREHEHVCQQIEDTLKSLGPVEKQKRRLLKLKTVQHLYTPMSVSLEQNQQDQKPLSFMKHLHPTPAVGGTPKEWARQFIKEHEPYDRGYYAAPVGLIRAKEEDFAVAIRSMLVDNQNCYLFAGCGIVKGSDAKQEWLEIHDKNKHLLDTLRGRHEL